MAGLPGIRMTANGTSNILTVNPIQTYSPFLGPAPSWSLGLIATVSSPPNLTYTVQVTADQQPSANGNWNNHDVLVSLTSSANSNVAFPITGLRVVITGYSSGTFNLGVCIWP